MPYARAALAIGRAVLPRHGADVARARPGVRDLVPARLPDCTGRAGRGGQRQAAERSVSALRGAVMPRTTHTHTHTHRCDAPHHTHTHTAVSGAASFAFGTGTVGVGPGRGTPRARGRPKPIKAFRPVFTAEPATPVTLNGLKYGPREACVGVGLVQCRHAATPAGTGSGGQHRTWCSWVASPLPRGRNRSAETWGNAGSTRQPGQPRP